MLTLVSIAHTFVCLQGGVLVSVVRGAMGPQLERSIKEQLAAEHKVLEEGVERKQVSLEWLCDGLTHL